MLEVNENGMILGKIIHSAIESKTKQYNIWVGRVLKDSDFKEGIDFRTILYESTGGRRAKDYEFTIQAAKEICLMERNEKGKQIRRWLINLSEKHDSGLAFTAQQIESLIDLSKSMTLISIQKECEKKHYDLHNNKYDWYNYRAAILGYTTNDLIEAMKKVNKKHHETRASLIQLDSNELIRVGVIDLMICLNKSIEYATNVGNLCKSIAEKMELCSHIWDDTKPNPIKINSNEVNKRKNLFNKTLKQIE